MVYIQRKCRFTNELETVDEFTTRKEARQMLKEYKFSDSTARYYISQRACKNSSFTLYSISCTTSANT